MFVESKTIALLAPEIILMLGATLLFMLGAFRAGRGQIVAALLTYGGAAVALAWYGSPWGAESTLSGPLVVDPMSLGLRWISLLAGIIFTLASARRDQELAAEFQGTLMLVACGAMLVASADELVLLFLGLELISIPTYVLLFLGRRDRSSAEATMKYFYLSLLSSALLLYGLALVYGICGTTVIAGTAEINGIREVFQNQGGTGSALSASAASLMKLAPVALVLITAGLGFKLAAAPFQFYAPDVYQGTTNANAGVLAVIPKLAGVAGFLRVALLVIPGTSVSEQAFAWQLPLVLAVLTMTIGNICALWQKDIRRLLAYSSIAHGGYLLIGLAVGAANLSTESHEAAGGAGAMLFYVLVYALATMGSFCTLAYLGSPRRELSGVEELSGLARNQPLAAAALAIFMFSLAGIPPLAGFWGKLNLFASAIQVPSVHLSPARYAELDQLKTSNDTLSADERQNVESRKSKERELEELKKPGKAPLSQEGQERIKQLKGDVEESLGKTAENDKKLAANQHEVERLEAAMAMAPWLIALAIAAALNAAIAAAYYLRIIGVMYFQPPGTKAASASGGRLALVGGVLCALLVIGSGMFPSQMVGLSLRAERKLMEQPPAPQKVSAETSPLAAAP